MHMVFTYGTC